MRGWPVGGLRAWAQSHWVREQRRQWREHDARLAIAWHASLGSETAIDDEPDRVIVLPDVIVLPEPDARMSTPAR